MKRFIAFSVGALLGLTFIVTKAYATGGQYEECGTNGASIQCTFSSCNYLGQTCVWLNPNHFGGVSTFVYGCGGQAGSFCSGTSPNCPGRISGGGGGACQCPDTQPGTCI